jgi:hypothetical protein
MRLHRQADLDWHCWCMQVVDGQLYQFWGMLNSVVQGSGLLHILRDLETQVGS